MHIYWDESTLFNLEKQSQKMSLDFPFIYGENRIRSIYCLILK